MGSNREIFKEFLQFINTADEKLGQKLISPNAKFYVPNQPEPLQGLKGYMMIIGMMRSGFSDIHWTVEDMIFEGDKVAARYTMRGTQDGNFMGIPPTGKKIEVHNMAFYKLAEGKFVEEQGLPDMFSLMMQIGVIPAP
jgi:predicted ester cyclase